MPDFLKRFDYADHERKRKWKIGCVVYWVSILVILGFLIGFFYPRTPEVSIKEVLVDSVNFTPDSASVTLEILFDITNPNYISVDVTKLHFDITYNGTKVGNVDGQDILIPSMKTQENTIDAEILVTDVTTIAKMSYAYTVDGYFTLHFKGPVSLKVASTVFTITLGFPQNVTND